MSRHRGLEAGEVSTEAVTLPDHPQSAFLKVFGGIVGTAILAVLGFFLEESYRSVQLELHEHQAAITALQQQMVESQSDRKAIREILKRMEESDVRIESKLDRLLLVRKADR